jgi:hypothetical protein
MSKKIWNQILLIDSVEVFLELFHLMYHLFKSDKESPGIRIPLSPF